MPALDLQDVIDAFADAVAERIVARTQPAPTAPMKDEWLTPKEAAAILKCSESRLETLRRVGGGPDFSKFGKKSIRYLHADLDKFAATRQKRRNTIKEQP